MTVVATVLRRSLPLSMAAVLLGLPAVASAASKTWTGLGADANWTTAGNWSGGAPSANDDLIFPDGAARLTNSNDFPAATAFSSITFSGTAGGYTLNGNSITLASSITSNNTTGLNLINFAIVLSGTVTVTQASSGALGLIGAISGGFGLTKNGGGEVDVHGANSYTGVTTINAGLLSLGINGSALGAGDGTAGTGTVIASGAQLIAASSSMNIANEAITLNGGEFGANVPSVTFGGPITVNAGGGSLDTLGASASVTVTGLISGIGALTKIGSGTATLTANNTYADTIVSGGTLLVMGSQSGTTATVNSSATLGGSGKVAQTTVLGGTIAPGTSPGMLSTGPVSFNASSTFAAELAGLAAGSGYDQLNVTGTVSLGGATLNATRFFSPAPGDKFTIILNDGVDPVVGTFSGLAEGATVVVGGIPFSISYVGGDGNDVVLTCLFAIVPTMRVEIEAVLFLALAGLAVLSLRRRASAR